MANHCPRHLHSPAILHQRFLHGGVANRRYPLPTQRRYDIVPHDKLDRITVVTFSCYRNEGAERLGTGAKCWAIFPRHTGEREAKKPAHSQKLWLMKDFGALCVRSETSMMNWPSLPRRRSADRWSRDITLESLLSCRLMRLARYASPCRTSSVRFHCTQSGGGGETIRRTPSRVLRKCDH
jgi:hypothetical protein